MGEKTALGIEENIAGALCYVLGWLTGILFLLLEKENRFVRFHAMQSLVIFLGLFIIMIALGWIPVLGLLILLVGIFLWVLLIFKAFKGEMFKLSLAGEFAEKHI